MKSNLSFAMRLYRIDQMLQEEGSVSFEKLQAALQCSAPTLKRDIRYMREAVGAPIVYSRAQNTYSYERGKEPARKNRHAPELPSPWFTPGEMYSFMAILQLLDRIECDPAAVLGDDIPAFLEEHKLDFTPQEIQGLFLNFRFDGSRLTCTTGVSVSKFTLDKSLEQTWDKWAQALFAGLQIPFESEL